jgi:hypothetical protein
MKRIGAVTGLIWFSLIFTPMDGVGQQSDRHSSYGTCAIFVSNGRDMAMVVDSVLTEKSVLTTPLHSLVCKTWLPNANIIAVTTGLWNAGPWFTGWDAQSSGREWLYDLPLNPTIDDVNISLRGWSDQLLTFLKKHPQLVPQEEREIASLVVGFNVGKTNQIFRERVVSRKGKAERDENDSPRQSIPRGASAFMYAGSCRDYIAVNGQRGIQIAQADLDHLNKLAMDMRSAAIISSAQQLGDLLRNYEQVLIDINNRYAASMNIDNIGPPIQLATLPFGSDRWVTSFAEPCPREP